jgi:hypothetical protein
VSQVHLLRSRLSSDLMLASSETSFCTQRFFTWFTTLTCLAQ